MHIHTEFDLDAAQNIYQSEGIQSQLCAPDGSFQSTLSSCEVCISKYTPLTSSGASEVYTQLDSALSYCAGITAATPTIPASTSSANSTPISSLSESASDSNPASITSKLSSYSSELAATSLASSVSSVCLSFSGSGTVPPNITGFYCPRPPSQHGLSRGAITGIAVGATIGGIALLTLVAWFR